MTFVQAAMKSLTNFRDSAELGMRSENKIGACGSPFGGLGRTVSSSPELATLVLLGPLEGGGQQVDEEVIGQLTLFLSEDTVG
jgi:hypothetical protein